MALKFYKQQHSNTCGVAVFRTLLKNTFNIYLTENSLIKLAESLYKEKHSKLSNYYKIKDNGTDSYHLINVAKHFGLRIFIKTHSNINNLKNLIKTGFWVIIHRPFELDRDGHYILVLNYDDKNIYLFDPTRLNGGIKKESYKLFYKKWAFGINKERWLICFYPKDRIKIRVKGKYL